MYFYPSSIQKVYATTGAEHFHQLLTRVASESITTRELISNFTEDARFETSTQWIYIKIRRVLIATVSTRYQNFNNLFSNNFTRTRMK